MRRDSAKHLVEFYPAAAVPTAGCAVPLCCITHNSVNVPFGFLVGEKKKTTFSLHATTGSFTSLGS